jgi:hypothetical protein
MSSTAPAYTFGGITRPALNFDANGNIILDPPAAQFAAEYGIKALYMGLPASTPYPPIGKPPPPPVTDSLSAPTDINAAANTVAEGAAVNTPVHLTASAHSGIGAPVTYFLIGDSSHGGFKINAATGVVSVANPAKLNYVTAPNHAYTVTVEASDGTLTSSHAFKIAVTLGPATHFSVGIPASGAAGAPGSVTVTALDALNHVVTGYTGTVHFTSSDGHAVLPANATLTNGIGTFSETLDTAGHQTITATDTAHAASPARRTAKR